MKSLLIGVNHAGNGAGLVPNALHVLQLSHQRKEMQKCKTQSMEAHDDGFRNGGDWSGLKLKARILIVTAMAVGFVLATPAQAIAPVVNKKLILRTPESAKAYAQTQLNKYGWDSKTQWEALHLLWTKESNWRPNAQNKTPVIVVKNGKKVKVYAGGIPQKLGLSPTVSVERQVTIGLDYIKHRYGSPLKALAFWKLNQWY